ncbi:MAG: molecular chaperone Tir, partial [Nitrospirae bacterium]|nr:molecular chaperone Tir [Nitrospirota bacterium]
MGRHFEKVKHYLMELNLHIVSEDEEKELVVVSDENLGIKNMVIDCEEPILIFEQIIM